MAGWHDPPSRRGRRWPALLLVLCCACVAPGPSLGEDQISDRDIWLPRDAREGSFIRWRCTGSRATEEEIACVAGPPGTTTIEWRTRLEDGTQTVTAARFDAHGTVLGAWRGPRGGVGRKLEIVPSDVGAAIQDAEARVSAHGLSADADSTVDRETIETAIGPLACTRQTITTTVLFTSGEVTTWHSVDPLPLSQHVRFRADMPGWHEVRELAACGWTGAVPTLQIPEKSSASGRR